MKVDCVALDLDETTLNCHSQLSPPTRAALEQLIAQGIEVVLASGRGFQTFPKELLTFPGIRYVIASNGTSIVDLTTGNYIYQQCLSPQAVGTILEVTSPFPVQYETFMDGHGYADQGYISAPEHYGASPKTAAYLQATRNPVEDIVDFISTHRNHLEAIDLMVFDPHIRKQACRALEQSGAPIYITSSTPFLVEISDENSGKESALRYLLDKLGIDPANTVAFGNGDNDAAMLAFCGCGIAVENATETCKAAADWITHHHDADGVVYALRHYLHLI